MENSSSTFHTTKQAEVRLFAIRAARRGRRITDRSNRPLATCGSLCHQPATCWQRGHEETAHISLEMTDSHAANRIITEVSPPKAG